MYNPRWPDAYVAWGEIRSLVHSASTRSRGHRARAYPRSAKRPRTCPQMAGGRIPAGNHHRLRPEPGRRGLLRRRARGDTPYSRREPEEILLDRHDLIWVGSLLTHLDAPLWRRFLGTFAEHLDGLVLFTTAGDFVAERDAPGRGERCRSRSAAGVLRLQRVRLRQLRGSGRLWAIQGDSGLGPHAAGNTALRGGGRDGTRLGRSPGRLHCRCAGNYRELGTSSSRSCFAAATMFCSDGSTSS